jgi:hypothetical protein
VIVAPVGAIVKAEYNQVLSLREVSVRVIPRGRLLSGTSERAKLSSDIVTQSFKADARSNPELFKNTTLTSTCAYVFSSFTCMILETPLLKITQCQARIRSSGCLIEAMGRYRSRLGPWKHKGMPVHRLHDDYNHRHRHSLCAPADNYDLEGLAVPCPLLCYFGSLIRSVKSTPPRVTWKTSIFCNVDASRRVSIENGRKERKD